jgi:hypothetical protein
MQKMWRMFLNQFWNKTGFDQTLAMEMDGLEFIKIPKKLIEMQMVDSSVSEKTSKGNLITPQFKSSQFPSDEWYRDQVSQNLNIILSVV